MQSMAFEYSTLIIVLIVFFALKNKQKILKLTMKMIYLK